MEREIERNKVFCVSFVSRGWVKEREREREGENLKGQRRQRVYEYLDLQNVWSSNFTGFESQPEPQEGVRK